MVFSEEVGAKNHAPRASHIGLMHDFLSPRINLCHTRRMNVERLKYVIWAADMQRAVNFYTKVFGGAVLK